MLCQIPIKTVGFGRKLVTLVHFFFFKRLLYACSNMLSIFKNPHEGKKIQAIILCCKETDGDANENENTLLTNALRSLTS